MSCLNIGYMQYKAILSTQHLRKPVWIIFITQKFNVHEPQQQLPPMNLMHCLINWLINSHSYYSHSFEDTHETG